MQSIDATKKTIGAAIVALGLVAATASLAGGLLRSPAENVAHDPAVAPQSSSAAALPSNLFDVSHSQDHLAATDPSRTIPPGSQDIFSDILVGDDVVISEEEILQIYNEVFGEQNTQTTARINAKAAEAAARVRVSADNSRAAKEAYLKAIETIGPATDADLAFFIDPPPDASMAQFSIHVRRLVAGHDRALAQAIALPVPSDWITYIRSAVAAMQKQREALALYAELPNDPLLFDIAISVSLEAAEEYDAIARTFVAHLNQEGFEITYP